MKKSLLLFYYISLLATFIFSIYGKLYDFVDFNNFISRSIQLNVDSSLVFSVLLLAVEFFLLIQLVLDRHAKELYLYIVSVLSFFTLILFYLLWINESGNCYCFGSFLKLSPTASIIKNLCLIWMSYCLYKENDNRDTRKYRFESSVYLIIISLILFSVIDKPQNFFRAEEIQKLRVQEIRNFDDFLIIDARHSTKYQVKHIANAINFPLIGDNISAATFKKEMNYLLNSKKMKWLVYCDSEFCTLASNLAFQLKEKFPAKKIYVLKGGIESWENYGLALEQF